MVGGATSGNITHMEVEVSSADPQRASIGCYSRYNTDSWNVYVSMMVVVSANVSTLASALLVSQVAELSFIWGRDTLGFDTFPTGVVLGSSQDPCEVPTRPDNIVDTVHGSPEEGSHEFVAALRRLGEL